MHPSKTGERGARSRQLLSAEPLGPSTPFEHPVLPCSLADMLQSVPRIGKGFPRLLPSGTFFQEGILLFGDVFAPTHPASFGA